MTLSIVYIMGIILIFTQFFNDPHPLPDRHLGTETVKYAGKILETTGPERTLVEGLLRPGRVGGINEKEIALLGRHPAILWKLGNVRKH